MNLVSAEILISGIVQGVGFRYFCLLKAQNLELKGWVKNLHDGSVCTTVEGKQADINEYFNALQIGSESSSVSQVDIKWLTYSGQFEDFKISR